MAEVEKSQGPVGLQRSIFILHQGFVILLSFILLVVEIFDCLEVDKGVDGFVTSLVVCPEVKC